MDNRPKEEKLKELKEKLAKYEAKLAKLLAEEDKAPGSRYGNEYLQNEIKVLEDHTRTIKAEIFSLQRS